MASCGCCGPGRLAASTFTHLVRSKWECGWLCRHIVACNIWCPGFGGVAALVTIMDHLHVPVSNRTAEQEHNCYIAQTPIPNYYVLHLHQLIHLLQECLKRHRASRHHACQASDACTAHLTLSTKDHNNCQGTNSHYCAQFAGYTSIIAFSDLQNQ